MFDTPDWVRETPLFLLAAIWLWGLIVCILNRRLSRWTNLLVAGFGLNSAVWLLIIAQLLGFTERLFSPGVFLEWFFPVVGLGQVTAVGLIVIGLVFLFMDLHKRFDGFKELLVRQSDNKNEVRPGARQSDEIQQ